MPVIEQPPTPREEDIDFNKGDEAQSQNEDEDPDNLIKIESPLKEPPETFKGKSLASAGEGTDTI